MNKGIFYFIITLLCTCLFFSCENEESIIGENLLINNQHDVFILADSLVEIASFSAIEDSLDAQNSSTNLLGSYFDPISGQTNASFCFQITLPNNEITFDANSISNIRLRFPLTDFFGDSTTNFNIKLSTLNQSINIENDMQYFTTDDFESTPIEGAEYLMNLSEILDSNALILQLPTSFGLNEILNLSSEALLNSESFTEVFYGFKLDVQPVIDNGAIIYLNSSSDDATLQIEYTNNKNDDVITNFPINSGVRLNHVNHDYDESLPLDTNFLFIQSMGGVFSELDFSFLENYQDSGFIVNDATLELSVFEENQNFKIPQQLNLYEYSDNNLISIEGLSGGILSSDNSYEFDITRHIQKILLENHNPICRLHTYQRSSNADRVILNKTIKLTLILIEG